jgi:hypothetical protein
MMGAKQRNFSPLPRDVSLEDLVPKVILMDKAAALDLG